MLGEFSRCSALWALGIAVYPKRVSLVGDHRSFVRDGNPIILISKLLSNGMESAERCERVATRGTARQGRL